MANIAPQQLAQQLYFMQNPAAGLQFQQQQALAQQMMQQGSEQQDPNAAINEGIGGNHIVPFSKLGGLARAAEMMTGAYLQNQNNQKLGQMMQGGTAPQNSPSDGQALGSAMSSGNSMPPPSMQDIVYGQMAPEYMKAQYAQQQERLKAQLDLQNAGPVKAAQTAQTPVDMNGHMTFMTPPGASAAQPPQGMPPAPQMANGQPQAPANMDELLNQQTSPQTNVMPNVIPGTTPGVDWNDPQSANTAKALGTKTGENLGDTEKTYNVVSAQLPRAIQRFQELRAAAPDASYGPGLTPPEGGGITNREQFANIFEPKTAKANQMIGQISSQGILPEIGPVIASTGGRGNQFMEKMASSASGIRLTDNPQVKAQAIDNVENQYVGNLKSQAAILRNAGKPALSDDQIDAMVAGYKAKNPISNPSSGNSGGINWVRQNGKLVQQ